MEGLKDTIVVRTSAKASDIVIVRGDFSTAEREEADIEIRTYDGQYYIPNEGKSRIRLLWHYDAGHVLTQLGLPDGPIWLGTPQHQVLFLQKLIEHQGSDPPSELVKAKEMLDSGAAFKDLPFFDVILDKAQTETMNLLNKPLAEMGVKFKTSKRGSGKMATLLDQELEKIVSELGPNASWNNILEKIEELAENFHDFWQDINREDEEIYIKAPDQRGFEEIRKFKAIQNRIPEIKKNIKNLCK